MIIDHLFTNKKLNEVAPPGDKAERMVRHIKQGYARDGKLTPREKGIAFATAWKAHNAGRVEEQGVAEGSEDTIYPNAEVIKSKNGKPVGEIYQDGNYWGAFHYRADHGYDFIDSREEAIEALKDLHQETGRSRPDYTVKGVAEGSLTELSTDKLAQYKTAAAADAKQADRSGDVKRGDRRFSGIVKATKKQFDNDAKKVNESRQARQALMAQIVNSR